MEALKEWLATNRRAARKKAQKMGVNALDQGTAGGVWLDFHRRFAIGEPNLQKIEHLPPVVESTIKTRIQNLTFNHRTAGSLP